MVHVLEATGTRCLHLRTIFVLMQVRYVGVSNETTYGVTQFIRAAEEHGLPRIVSIQVSICLCIDITLLGAVLSKPEAVYLCCSIRIAHRNSCPVNLCKSR